MRELPVGWKSEKIDPLKIPRIVKSAVVGVVEKESIKVMRVAGKKSKKCCK